MENTGQDTQSLKAPLAGVFLCSASAISFEIALTRIFSISLSYHFAFMVISIALLGIGLSGTVLSLYPSLRRRGLLGSYALAQALTMAGGYLIANSLPFDPARLAWDAGQFFYVAVYYAVLGTPFFFFGLIVSSWLSMASSRAGFIYGADLLGAGTGSLCVIVLTGIFGTANVVFTVSLGALLAAALFGRPAKAALAALVLVAVPLFFPGLTGPRLSEYKGLAQALRFPGAMHMETYENSYSRVDVFESPMVRYAPGLSLKYLEDLPRQIGISVDGSSVNAITDAAPEKLAFLSSLPSALPYEIGRPERVLVVEPKGGLPVLLARHYGASIITSVESNALVRRVIQGEYAVISKDIYGGDSHTGLARSILRRTGGSFDLIDIQLTASVPASTMGLSEDYALTKEAFAQYLSRLSPGGILSISQFILPPPRAALRLLATAIAALENMGVKNPEVHLAAIRSWGTIHLFVKNTPFTEREVGRLRNFSATNRFDVVYHPWVYEDETNVYVKMPSDYYYKYFKSIIDSDTREAFINNYVFDIGATSDDRPFFHHYLKPGRLGEAYEQAGRKWQFFLEEGFLAPIVLAQAVLISLLLLVLPALKSQASLSGSGEMMLAYFMLLGAAFMFVEIPLLQSMILPLENPFMAIAAVLAAVLVSSGIGSLLSQRIPALARPGSVLALSAVVVCYAFFLGIVLDGISPLPFPLKLLLSIVIIAPAGVLMGIPFPTGMRLLGQRSPELIPWAWAVNGCMSVIAPVLAVIIAVAWGFQTVLLLGALAYAGAYAILLTYFKGVPGAGTT